MADVNKEVRVAFNGDDNLSKVITKINSSVDGFTDKVRGVTTPLADMSEAVLKVEAALGLLVVGGMALAIKTAGDFDTKFREITTLFDASPDSVDKFKKAIISFATSSMTPLEEVGTAIYEAISAGIDWGKSVEFLTEVEKLNVAGKGELVGTTTLLAGTMNAYGKNVDDLSDLNDILFQGVKLGNITLQDFSSGLGDAIGIAAGAKVPFDDLVAAISGLTAYGVPAAQAITGVKSAIAEIIAPSEQAKEQADALGLEFDAEALAAKGLDGVLADVYETTGGNVEQMFKLFGRVEALNAVILLGEDAGGKYSSAMKLMETRAGETAKAYEKMGGSFENINTRLVNSMKATLIEIGEPLLDEYAAVATGLSDIFKNLKVEVSKGTFQPFFDLVEEFGDDLAVALKEIAKNMPEAFAGIDWSKLTESLEDLGDAVVGLFEAVFGDIDLTTAEGLQKVIQKIVDGIAALTEVVAGILTSWQPFIAGLAKAADEFIRMDPATQKTAGSVLGFGQAIDKVLSYVDAFKGGIEFLGGAVALLGVTQLPSAITAVSGLAAAVPAATTVLSAFSGVAVALSAGWVLDKILDATLPGWEKNKEAIADNISAMHGADTGLDELSSSLEDTGDVVEEQKDIWQELSDAIDSLPENVETEVEAKGTELTQKEIDDIVEAFKDIPKETNTEIKADADEEKIEKEIKKIGNLVIEEYPDGIVIITQAEADQGSIDDVKEAVDGIPSEKMLEIKLEGEIQTDLAEIKASAETMQTYFEWSAKLEIAELEASAKIATAIAESLGTAWESTGSVIVELFQILEGLSGGAYWIALKIIEQEAEARKVLLEKQAELVEAQAEYLRKRAEALAQGDALIKFEMEGIYPELEAIMWKIIERVQIQANAEGVSFLLGAT